LKSPEDGHRETNVDEITTKSPGQATVCSTKLEILNNAANLAPLTSKP
jgi:hypothetical protein